MFEFWWSQTKAFCLSDQAWRPLPILTQQKRKQQKCDNKSSEKLPRQQSLGFGWLTKVGENSLIWINRTGIGKLELMTVSFS